DPGAQVALEIFGLWPKGVRFSKKPAAEEVPTISVGLVVLKGQAALKVGAEQYAIEAPPGAAYFNWDNIGGADRTPHRSAQLPAWGRPQTSPTPEVKAV